MLLLNFDRFVTCAHTPTYKYLEYVYVYNNTWLNIFIYKGEPLQFLKCSYITTLLSFIGVGLSVISLLSLGWVISTPTLLPAY